MATARCTWDAVSGVDGYNVYLKSNGEFVKQNSELIEGTVYDIENLEDGNYEAYAASVRNGFESEPSNVIPFTIGLLVVESHETTNTGDFVSEYTVDRPSGVQEGDLLIVTIAGRHGTSSSNSATYPTGWQQIQSAVGGSTESVMFVAYKIATSSEPASYTFTTTDPIRGSAGILRISGADQLDPIIDSSSNAGTGTNVTANQINVDGEGLLICSMSASGASTTPSLTTPGGMQSIWDETNQSTSTVRNITRVSSEEFSGDMTGIRTATSNGENFAAILIGVRA